VAAIEGVTESTYSHCGIVARQNGHWVVYEAYRNVEATPLREFLFRGRSQGFAVYRLKPSHRSWIPKTLEATRTFPGRPYDSRYRFDDEKIYCSELIYKAFEKASGEQLGIPAKVKELNWRPFEKTIVHYEGGPVPLERLMITPKAMALAPQLGVV